jgi:hypothetical protein
MSDTTVYIRELLSHMGIPADVQVDNNNQTVVVIETQAFQQRRAWIETWFTLIDQRDQYSYFRERLRGTGQTV